MTGVLQGIGKQVYPLINLFIGLIAKVIVTWTLVGNTEVNVMGAPLGTLSAYIIAAALDFYCLKKFTGISLDGRQIIAKPLISSLIMGVVVAGAYYGLMALSGSNTLSTLLGILVGVISYGMLVIRTKTILRDELMELPMGTRLVKICDKLNIW